MRSWIATYYVTDVNGEGYRYTYAVRAKTSSEVPEIVRKNDKHLKYVDVRRVNIKLAPPKKKIRKKRRRGWKKASSAK